MTRHPTVLVTGGCGFIGANLVRRLEAMGRKVRVLDNLALGDAAYLHGTAAQVVQGDVRDTALVNEALQGVEEVVHLAARGSVVDSVADPTANFEANVVGTFCLLNACVGSGIEKFFFASTGGALIGDAEPPVNEDSLPRPISPYGASKLCAEAYLHAFAKSYGLQTVALRFANVYGPYSGHKKGIVTAYIKALQTGEPLIIYGDGTSSRDYLYVDDLCRGVTRAMEADLAPGTVLHLASGVETTVAEMAELMIRASGKTEHEILHLPRRPGEVDRNFADFARAREAIGFTPNVGLQEGVERTWRWFSKHRGAAA
jgi:UDP-glucose 4-epimerase